MNESDLARIKNIWLHLGELYEELGDIVKYNDTTPRVFVSASGDVVTSNDEPNDKLQISDLKIGMEGISIIADVATIGALSTVTRKSDGVKVERQTINLMDDTGSIVLTLWDQEIDHLKNIIQGDTVCVDAWRVKKGFGKNQKELQLGKLGKIELLKRNKEQAIL